MCAPTQNRGARAAPLRRRRRVRLTPASKQPLLTSRIPSRLAAACSGVFPLAPARLHPPFSCVSCEHAGRAPPPFPPCCAISHSLGPPRQQLGGSRSHVTRISPKSNVPGGSWVCRREMWWWQAGPARPPGARQKPLTTWLRASLPQLHPSSLLEAPCSGAAAESPVQELPH